MLCAFLAVCLLRFAPIVLCSGRWGIFLCEAQKDPRLSKNLPLRGRCPEGAEGENLAIARNISGNRTVLSPTACGRSPLAEGAKGGAHLFRHAGIFLCFAQKKSQHHGRGRACPARGLTKAPVCGKLPRADIESAPTGNRCRPLCGLYGGRGALTPPRGVGDAAPYSGEPRTFPLWQTPTAACGQAALRIARKKVIPPGTIATL